jgi:hypothetical protein
MPHGACVARGTSAACSARPSDSAAHGTGHSAASSDDAAIEAPDTDRRLAACGHGLPSNSLHAAGMAQCAAVAMSVPGHSLASVRELWPVEDGPRTAPQPSHGCPPALQPQRAADGLVAREEEAEQPRCPALPSKPSQCDPHGKDIGARMPEAGTKVRAAAAALCSDACTAHALYCADPSCHFSWPSSHAFLLSGHSTGWRVPPADRQRVPTLPRPLAAHDARAGPAHRAVAPLRHHARQEPQRIVPLARRHAQVRL